MKKETEVRFLEVDKDALVAKLRLLGAEDLGESMLEEVIIYDPDLTWLAKRKFLRLRKKGDATTLTYKEHPADPKDFPRELEFSVPDLDAAVQLFEHIGFPPYRRQQKKRHTLHLNTVTFDIDTWPRIPTYVEIEGPGLADLKRAAEAVNFDWENAVFEDAKEVIEKVYGIPVGNMRWFTFERCE